MDFIIKNLSKIYTRQEIVKLKKTVVQINKLEAKISELTDAQLKDKTKEFKLRLKSGETLDGILPEAYAVVRETGKRTLKERAYDVQLMGAIAVHQGKIAEMKTGEGKTLTISFPAYLNSLEEKGVHIITVNDYLAKRDARWMSKIYHNLGIQVGIITANKTHTEKKQSYQMDVTYGVNSEFGFDYLRDNMAESQKEIVQRQLYFAVIDEADSVLIDEAQTPLIISAPADEYQEKYREFARLIERLNQDTDFTIDEKIQTVNLTEQGVKKMEKLLDIKNLYGKDNIIYIYHIEQALKAKELFKKDRDYIIDRGKIIIVDEYTGRLMHGHRYCEGIHQAIEAKENVEIKQEDITLAIITYQNFFLGYKKLAGLTGTAASAAREFDKIYHKEVVVVPTNKPIVRKDLPDKFYPNQTEKNKDIIEKITRLHHQGQPILAGTRSVKKSEQLSKLLWQNNIPHHILNAKNIEKEAEVVARAGQAGSVTIATNLAGRGTDIKLGPGIASLGGLYVIGTERHQARRIDNQLRGRAGRQGDPGFSEFYISPEDELIKQYGAKKSLSALKILNWKALGSGIQNKMLSNILNKAQARVESFYFHRRFNIFQYDQILNYQRCSIYRQRRRILFDKNFKPETLNLIKKEVTRIVLSCTPRKDLSKWEYEEIIRTYNSLFPFSVKENFPLTKMVHFKNKNELIKYLYEFAETTYNKREKEIGPWAMRMLENTVALKIIDSFWTEHLRMIQLFQEAVRFETIGQRNPLREYKNAAGELYEKLILNIQIGIVRLIFRTMFAFKDDDISEKELNRKEN
jgi:preprotein translocase subunit SecA